MSSTPIAQRLKLLKTHLAAENSILLDSISTFRKLDKVGYATGLLSKDDSFAMQIPWWPLISVLGTYSAGKSTFINHYIGEKIQRSGNQAVDDKFTVLCYSQESTFQALPGVALDSDPRFPFYRMSEQIEQVMEGEGSKIDSYIQLKTANSEALRGKIIIDSPGFDADRQRDSTLRITDHIIDLSDLVIVFFDARHPEPGAMRDTLDHLVSATIQRDDSSKFLYVLNQIDTAAKDDNAESVVAAWQRALGERGLSAGRFYTIYNPDVATPIEDEALRERFERKRDIDLDDIHSRMRQIGIERAYRIVAALENIARDIETRAIPLLNELMAKWRKRTLILDVLGWGVLIYLAYRSGWIPSVYAGQSLSLFDGFLNLKPAYTGWLLTGIAFGWHLISRKLVANSLKRTVNKAQDFIGPKLNIRTAFAKSTSYYHTIFSFKPKGWNYLNRNRINKVREEADTYVQGLNDRYTNPSGKNMLEVQNVGVDADVLNPRKQQSRSTPDVNKEETKLETVVNETQGA
jgi:GTPase SAR1 family protein